MGKSSRQDTQKPEEEAAAHPAAIENVEVNLAQSASEKPKKARFVREKVAKKTPVKDAAIPPRNTTVAGKLMSRNVTQRPVE
ncbi:MAG: hypothetical protein C0467_32460, partial [Planctomycetaceae bacterium]|nr:hypothetical protein [Planctomycetaceae bacterium]